MDDGLHDWGWVGRERALPGATALLILGMHRSGTSAVTRVLNLRGAQVVRQLHGPSASNPRGHWEPAELSSIHDGLFGFLNSDWTDFRSLDLARLKVEVCNQFEQWLIELLGRNFASAGLFAIKDPRMCRFVPLWLDVTRKFGAEPKAVIPVRNPLEVAASLRRRDGLSSAHSHLLWLRHVLDTELHTREIDRVFVTYPVLLSDWKRTTDWIARKLKITWPLSAEDSGADVDAFLDKKLRHHEVSPSELQRHSGTPALVKVAFEALAMAAEKEIGDDAAFQNGFDRIRAELDQIVESCGMQSRKYLGGLSRRDGEVSGPVSAESAQSAQIAVLLERIDALDEQVAELERARIDAELERARIDAELERARIEAGLEHALLSEACAEAQQRLAHARHGLNDMKKSMSWKLMKPARSAARLLTRRSLRNNLKFPENHADAS